MKPSQTRPRRTAVAEMVPMLLLTPEEAARVKMDLASEGAVSINDAVELTGVHRTTLYKLMESGKLPYVLIGRRRLLHRKALRELISSNTVLRHQISVSV